MACASAARAWCMLSVSAWHLVTAPVYLRCGMDRLLLQMQSLLDRPVAEGEAYVVVNRARSRLKVLCVDRHGVWLCARRLHQGHFIWPRVGDTAWTLSAEQWAWLCVGVDWQRLSIAPMAGVRQL
ncbi:IS66 family insertion sequence element accessory protein TnpB [Xanthomonas cucurbitae]|uniref:IS66 family insertion sequence element accessory protein TnpB n=2 Tax=Xanthomonas cucurbitae TaxID=56453 RepID=A0ABY7YI64_9XANT|nr:IS66 family insertion sequence element accessory protein TnpB [Xanthomonas cucurbitae]